MSQLQGSWSVWPSAGKGKHHGNKLVGHPSSSRVFGKNPSFLDGCMCCMSGLETGQRRIKGKKEREGPLPRLQRLLRPGLLGLDGDRGLQQAFRDKDSACQFQWPSPTSQVEHLHLVLQVETKVLWRTNSRERQVESREKRRDRHNNMENFFFLNHTITCLFPQKQLSRQGQTWRECLLLDTQA